MMTQTQPDGKGRPAISEEREGPAAAAYTKATMTIQQFYRPTWQDHGEWIDYYQVPRSRARRTLRNLRRRNSGLQFRALPTEADPDDTRQEATDLQDEAEALIRQTRKDRAAQDPEAERKRIADAFAGLNIRPVDLTAYLGHPLAQCTPAELVELRGLYGALRDGEATWASVMADRAVAGEEPPPPSPSAPDEPPVNPVIADLLTRIETATLDDLKTLSADVSLLQGPERRRVTAAWKARQKALHAGTTDASTPTA